ncbi:alpha/beta hydrolase family protein [Chitinimonas arctica]|uniref:alpha/beta hydrolase family protein n=1 Tax=Chitinimonas arctica TaxID=2594795 RepID=UPI0015D28708|nr:alpha/beta fold hydrolase [Chitinimonas arctica]
MRNQNGRMALGVFDTDNFNKKSGAVLRPVVIATYANLDVSNVHWVNDDRLSYDFEDSKDDTNIIPGSVFAVNRDGSQRTQLMSKDYKYKQDATGSRIRDSVLPWDYDYYQSLHDGSDDIIVEKNTYSGRDYSVTASRLYRLNTKTRALTDVVEAGFPANIVSWVLDTDGIPALGVARDKGVTTYHRYDKAGKTWSKLAEFKTYSFSGYRPEFVDFDGKLYTSQSGKDGFAALYRFLDKSAALEEAPWMKVAGFDAAGSPMLDHKARQLLGIEYQADAYSTYWRHPTMKAMQERIDAKLTSTSNTLSCGDCLSSPVVLVTARSDKQPAVFFLYRPATDEYFQLGRQYPDIDARLMGSRDFVRFAARDGLSIPMYITKPAGQEKGPLPTVVLVHGGPYVRGSSWEWEAEAQFLASRGYLVLQPEFRGSTGYGSALFKAGWKQWGQAMQDDLADAAKWAVAQGLADNKRIAIAGASYGGYATLMGMIKHPDIYRCGFEWVGVSDINLMYDDSWSDATNNWLKYAMPEMVADQKRDAALIKEYSPLEQAHRLKQPLLMAYGEDDRRVPLSHGAKFHDAVKAHNAQVDYVVYSGEGHGWYLEKTRFDFWRKVESFLERNLKPAP